MSNVYDFNPSGVIPLARLIQSQIPATASPDTPEPLPTPGGGLPGGAPTGPYTPSGLGSLIGNIGSGLAGLAKSYFAAGQPSVWGQPSPGATQGPDEAGMIAGAPQPQPPDTTGAGGPAGPSQMQQQPPTQWPPSQQLPKAEPPASEKPPTADRAPPRQEPYIPSRRDTRPNAWGRPDLVEQGASRYPGLLPGPFMPQPHEWRGVMGGATQFLGNLGSGVVAPLARALAGLDPAYHKAKQSGEEHRAKMVAASFALYSKQLAQKQAQESREYGEAFAAYGPRTDEKGRTVPGDEDALREAILTIAARNHDDKIPAVLARGGLPAVERLIQARDSHGKDASKVLIQMQRRNSIILQEQRIEANRAKARAAQGAQYPWLIGGGAGAGGTPAGAMAPAGPGAGGGAASSGDEHEFDPHFGGTATTQSAKPDEPDQPEEPIVPDEPEAKDDQPDSSDSKDSAAKDQPEPTREAAAEPDVPPAAAPDRPIRLAARTDTGTMTDAPPPEAAPPPKAEALPRTAAAGPPAAAGAAPAAGTPAAMGAGAPVPSLQPQERVPPGRVPMLQEPGQAAAAEPTPAADGAAAAPGYEWQPSRSRAREQAASQTIQTERGPMRPNFELIDSLAQQMVNGTRKREELKNYPDWVVTLARARGDEIVADMHKIAADPNITSPEQVYAALQKINPEFGASLRGYVNGNFSVPQSAWANPGYKGRTIELGGKADPGFNEFTAKNRAATLKDAAVGNIAKGLTFTATAYRHLHHVEELMKMRPEGYFKRIFSNYDTPGWVDKWIGLHPEDRDVIGALENAVNTANSEYERALVGGRPTVAGRKGQEAEFPLIVGSTRKMLANIRDKQIMLRDRLDELENQFNAGTGMQPRAMYDRFRKASDLASRQRDMDNIQTLQAGGNDTDPTRYGGFRRGSPPAEPAPLPARRGGPAAAPAGAPAGDVVDYRTYFGQ